MNSTSVRARLRGNQVLYEIESDCVVLGRNEDCDIVLSSARSVSGRHCEIRFESSESSGSSHSSPARESDSVRVLLVDLESRNGTFVNDIRLPSGSCTQLRHGDVLRCGFDHASYRFELPSADISHFDEYRSTPPSIVDSARTKDPSVQGNTRGIRPNQRYLVENEHAHHSSGLVDESSYPLSRDQKSRVRVQRLSPPPPAISSKKKNAPAFSRNAVNLEPRGLGEGSQRTPFSSSSKPSNVRKEGSDRVVYPVLLGGENSTDSSRFSSIAQQEEEEYILQDHDTNSVEDPTEGSAFAVTPPNSIHRLPASQRQALSHTSRVPRGRGIDASQVPHSVVFPSAFGVSSIHNDTCPEDSPQEIFSSSNAEHPVRQGSLDNYSSRLCSPRAASGNSALEEQEMYASKRNSKNSKGSRVSQPSDQNEAVESREEIARLENRIRELEMKSNRPPSVHSFASSDEDDSAPSTLARLSKTLSSKKEMHADFASRDLEPLRSLVLGLRSVRDDMDDLSKKIRYGDVPMIREGIPPDEVLSPLLERMRASCGDDDVLQNLVFANPVIEYLLDELDTTREKLKELNDAQVAKKLEDQENMRQRQSKSSETSSENAIVQCSRLEEDEVRLANRARGLSRYVADLQRDNQRLRVETYSLNRQVEGLRNDMRAEETAKMKRALRQSRKQLSNVKQELADVYQLVQQQEGDVCVSQAQQIARLQRQLEEMEFRRRRSDRQWFSLKNENESLRQRVESLEESASAHVAAAEAHVIRSDRIIASLHASMAEIASAGDDAKLLAAHVLVEQLSELKGDVSQSRQDELEARSENEKLRARIRELEHSILSLRASHRPERIEQLENLIEQLRSEGGTERMISLQDQLSQMHAENADMVEKARFFSNELKQALARESGHFDAEEAFDQLASLAQEQEQTIRSLRHSQMHENSRREAWKQEIQKGSTGSPTQRTSRSVLGPTNNDQHGVGSHVRPRGILRFDATGVDDTHEVPLTSEEMSVSTSSSKTMERKKKVKDLFQSALQRRSLNDGDLSLPRREGLPSSLRRELDSSAALGGRSSPTRTRRHGGSDSNPLDEILSTYGKKNSAILDVPNLHEEPEIPTELGSSLDVDEKSRFEKSVSNLFGGEEEEDEDGADREKLLGLLDRQRRPGSNRVSFEDDDSRVDGFSPISLPEQHVSASSEPRGNDTTGRNQRPSLSVSSSMSPLRSSKSPLRSPGGWIDVAERELF